MVWTVLWIGWIGAFIVLEGVALYRPQEGDTLSEQVRHWLHYGPDQVPSPIVWLARGSVLTLLVWLIPHWLS